MSRGVARTIFFSRNTGLKKKMGISGTAALLSRLMNLRNVVRIVGGPSGIAPRFGRNLSIVARSYSVDINSVIDTEETDVKPKKKLSKAMKAYLERAKEYDQFMKKEIAEFRIGKRHLANMMGADPETFTQKDINESISYLFPSGLYEKKARPIMEPPEKIFPPRKEAQFDESGRPYHTLFYTCKPNFYQVLHDIVGHLYSLNDYEDKAMKDGIVPRPDNKINLLGSQWMTKTQLELFLLESLRDDYYDKFIVAADRLADHPFAFQVKDFIMKFRTNITSQTANVSIPELKFTPEGRPYITVKDSKRKTAIANVTIFGKGTGKITINGKDISYFWDIQSREQVSWANPRKDYAVLTFPIKSFNIQHLKNDRYKETSTFIAFLSFCTPYSLVEKKLHIEASNGYE